MAKTVTTIPATLSRFTSAPINSKKKRRVAAYARVSTDNEEQLTSLRSAGRLLHKLYPRAGRLGVRQRLYRRGNHRDEHQKA